jgi:hypothetical protein
MDKMFRMGRKILLFSCRNTLPKSVLQRNKLGSALGSVAACLSLPKNFGHYLSTEVQRQMINTYEVENSTDPLLKRVYEYCLGYDDDDLVQDNIQQVEWALQELADVLEENPHLDSVEFIRSISE